MRVFAGVSSEIGLRLDVKRQLDNRKRRLSVGLLDIGL